MKTVIWTILAFLLCACHREVSEYAKVILEDAGTDWSLYVKGDSSQVLIPLETTEEALIGEYDRILMTDSVICVLDYSKSRSIFIFDGEGHFKSKIMKIGRGPGEYVFPDGIALKGDTILVNDRVARKMLYYGLDGTFYKEVHFGDYRPIPFALKDSTHLVFYFPMPGYTKDNAEVAVTDLNGKFTEQYFKRPDLTDKQGRFAVPDYFTQNANGIFFIPVFEDKMYRLTEDSVQMVFDFQFKDFMYSFDEIGEKPIIEHERKYSYFDDFFMTDEGTFVCFICRGNLNLVNLCGNIYTGDLLTWEGDWPVEGVFKNYFITTTEYKEGEQSDMGNNRALLLIPGSRLMNR